MNSRRNLLGHLLAPFEETVTGITVHRVNVSVIAMHRNVTAQPRGTSKCDIGLSGWRERERDNAQNKLSLQIDGSIPTENNNGSMHFAVGLEAHRAREERSKRASKNREIPGTAETTAKNPR